ncbi:type IV secretory system conjugative DNA transfer family protein [Mucilaginibacter terrae]
MNDDPKQGQEPYSNKAYPTLYDFSQLETKEPDFWEKLGISKDELKLLLRFRTDYEKRSKIAVFMVGVWLTPITLIGALLGFVRGYNRILRPFDIFPDFYPMRPIIRFAMIVGAIGIWLLLLIGCLLLWPFIDKEYFGIVFVIGYLFANTVFSFVVYALFRRWRIGVNNGLVEGEKFGTARFANPWEIAPFGELQDGLYIGGGCHYNKQGHLLTVAGSRSGKFTNLIAPNLLGWGKIDGSYFIIDPKGEIAAVTYDYNRDSKRQIVMLNPWGLLENDVLPPSYAYNPMDILDVNSVHMVDDCQMLAEMLVPIEKDSRNRFFSDSARTVVAGFLLYIAVSEPKETRTLTTLWKWVRYSQLLWDRLLSEMALADDLPFADNLLYASQEIEKLSKSGQNTWGSILSSVLQATDFLKSGSLQKSLQSDFDPSLLAEGNITLYVIIPADKLQSHSRWLRLVTTSMMRAVIRKPQKRVVFLLDEFAALGYLPEIEIALGAYAGFNVTVWPILQSLVQLKNLYGENWEVFIGNTVVRQYFGIQNNHDAEYISKAMGKKSHVIETVRWFGNEDAVANERNLITPDELRIESGKKIFTFIDDLPPVMFEKLPYFKVQELNDRARENPYIR